MTNLTISLDDQLIKQARVRAIQQGTSLSAKIREFLAAYASGAADRRSGDAATDLMRLIEDVRAEARENAAQEVDPAKLGTVAGRRTLRDELYEGDFRARARVEAAWDRTRNPR